MENGEEKDRLVFVTGLSGAGITSALKFLEDMGYDVFDNLPLNFLDALLEQQKPFHRPVALGMDTRTRDFSADKIVSALEALKTGGGRAVRSFFLTADDATLLRRFTETRRTHPMARDRAVSDGIATEKSLLYPLKYQADAIIDTSEFSIHDLRRTLEGHIGGVRANRMNITVMSFSYRHGVPREADIVFDMRFLRNPNWVPELKDLTGREKPVRDYVEGDPAFAEFARSLRQTLSAAMPGYAREGKNYLTLAFGCTGGKHRSVALAESFGEWLNGMNYPALVHHREIKT